MSESCQINIDPITDWRAVEPLWIELETRAPCSFFQSWAWIGTWLSQLPPRIQTSLVRIDAQDRLIGLAVVCTQQLQYPLFKVDGLHINETGSLDFDRLTIEYNGLLLESGHAPTLLPRIFDAFLDFGSWHELRIGGLDASLLPAYRQAAETCGLDCRIRDEKPCHGVCLDELREADAEYLSTLSRNTRYQIRRSIREYEKRGALELTVAGDMATATAFLAGLQELHQQYWTARGLPGAFSTEWVRNFHDTLLATRFPQGDIQLIRVDCGAEPIAYLYNFIREGKVYCYQSGLVYEDNSHLKPGLVAHALTIEHNLAAGMHLYDFLMGKERYKANLGNTRSDMYWLSLRRPLLRYTVHESLAALKARVRKRLAATG